MSSPANAGDPGDAKTMKSEGSFSPAEIQAEHERLGHKLGWRLFTCPFQNIETASVALITINPGGSEFEEPRWSVEDGSAYELESWKNRPPGQENLQRQVRRMFEIMNIPPAKVLSGYLVPFRSQRWQALPHKSTSIHFGIKIWREVFKKTNVRTVIAFGKDIAPQMVSLLNATSLTEYPTGWGEQKISMYRFGQGGSLVVLPHLSTFKLFSDQKYESAFRVVLGKI
jgi:hypothetical protein